MIDPSTIRLTRHVVDRYMERRGWPLADEVSRLDAEWTIRELLTRVAQQNPPLWQKGGEKPVRRYTHGNLAWIVSADNTTVVTFYAVDRKSSKRHASRKARHERNAA